MANPSPTGHCQVTVTAGTHEEALALAHAAVTARLAACAQVVGPITSVYRWQGRVETAEEWQCLMKTAADRYPTLEALVRERHSYDVPEIIRTPIDAGSPDYLSWLTAETRPH